MIRFTLLLFCTISSFGTKSNSIVNAFKNQPDSHNINIYSQSLQRVAKNDSDDVLMVRSASLEGLANILVKIPIKIQSVKYGEYLYTTNWDGNWKTMPSGFSSSAYYPAFTHRDKKVDVTVKFYLEAEGHRYWIRCGRDEIETRYLDTSHATNVRTPICSVRPEKTAINLIPIDGGSYYIQNAQTGQFMYAGTDEEREYADRRPTFSNGTYEFRDSSYEWIISSYCK